MKFFIFKILIVVMILSFTASAYSQINYRQTGNIKVTIAGTSTLHAWAMISTQASCNAVFETTPDGQPVKVQSVTFSLPAESLKSGKNAMDNNAYNSLKTDKFKQISFSLASARVTEKQVLCSGNLTIAGTTKIVEVAAPFELRNGNPVFKVVKKIKMSEFNVEPPSFMFGSVKTGDEITITIDVPLAPSKI
jgi:hypothetical protein